MYIPRPTSMLSILKLIFLFLKYLHLRLNHWTYLKPPLYEINLFLMIINIYLKNKIDEMFMTDQTEEYFE